VRLTWGTRVDWASLFILSDTCFLAGLCPASRWAPHPLYYLAAREPGLPFLRGEGKSVANFAIILYIEQHNCEQNLYTSSEGGSFSDLIYPNEEI
jgi:hypothetical protein